MVKTLGFRRWDLGSLPCQRTEILQASQCGKMKEGKKESFRNGKSSSFSIILFLEHSLLPLIFVRVHPQLEVNARGEKECLPETCCYASCSPATLCLPLYAHLCCEFLKPGDRFSCNFSSLESYVH